MRKDTIGHAIARSCELLLPCNAWGTHLLKFWLCGRHLVLLRLRQDWNGDAGDAVKVPVLLRLSHIAARWLAWLLES